MIVIKGIAASPGIAIGRAYVDEDEDIVVERVEIPRDKIQEEVRRFKIAQKATHRDLDAAEIKVLKVLGKHHAKLIDAHRLILKGSCLPNEADLFIALDCLDLIHKICCIGKSRSRQVFLQMLIKCSGHRPLSYDADLCLLLAP